MSSRVFINIVIAATASFIILFMLKSCNISKTKTYSNCTTEESYGVDVDIKDVDIDIFIIDPDDDEGLKLIPKEKMKVIEDLKKAE